MVLVQSACSSVFSIVFPHETTPIFRSTDPLLHRPSKKNLQMRFPLASVDLSALAVSAAWISASLNSWEKLQLSPCLQPPGVRK
jgi:hypothetical protein